MCISEKYWQQLLTLRSLSANRKEESVLIGFSDEICVFFDSLQGSQLDKLSVIISFAPLEIESWKTVEIFSKRLYLTFSPELNHQTQTFLQLYLPLATAKIHHRDQSFVIAHMAQSLDGKVCTQSGTSKWIGNQHNLIHAHRIRALVDGVIVGGNTARSEKPSLNVRHVNGPDPARILLCNSSHSLEGLPEIEGMRNFLLCQKNCIDQLDHRALESAKLKTLSYCGDSDDQGISAALMSLRQENVQSILLEGGPTTIKAFIQNEALSWLQLHTAPIVFGSGHSFVSLPEITQVDQALKLSNVIYTQMGDAMVVTGQL